MVQTVRNNLDKNSLKSVYNLRKFGRQWPPCLASLALLTKHQKILLQLLK